MLIIELKRRFPIDKIYGITVKNISDKFIIHGEDNEYDYVYSSKKRKEIIEIISSVYMDLKKTDLKISLVDDTSVKKYVTTETEKKNNPNITKMNLEKLSNLNEYLYNFKMIFSSDEKIKEINLKNFNVLKIIGKASYGRLILCENNLSKDRYTTKIFYKNEIVSPDKIYESTNKDFDENKCPFLSKLNFCFQYKDKIYFFMEYLPGGEFFHHLRKFRFFDEDKVCFYGFQIAIALEFLHKKNIVYSDLKPENIFLDEKGYLKLANFGNFKSLKNYKEKIEFVGTPEYLAPEILKGENYNYSLDWWCFGILLFEMLYGITPFYDNDSSIMFRRIKEEEVKFPDEINYDKEEIKFLDEIKYHKEEVEFLDKIKISEDAKDIIKNLLQKNPNERLGSKSGIEEIVNHSFFKKFNYDSIEKKKIEASFIPQLNNDNVNDFIKYI